MKAEKHAASEGPSLLDVVALLADVPGEGLARGQVGTVVEQFDALLRRAVLPVREDEEPVPLQPMCVIGCALHGHAQALRDRPQSRVSVRRDFVEEEESRARPQVAEQLHSTTQSDATGKAQANILI